MILDLKQFKNDLKHLNRHGSSRCVLVNVYMISDSELYHRFVTERLRVAFPLVLVVEESKIFSGFSNDSYSKIMDKIYNREIVLFSFENADVGFGYNIEHLRSKVQAVVDESFRQRIDKTFKRMESEHVVR
jgi:hypothetical protein